MDLVGIGGLGEIIDGAELHRGHGRRDIGIARQDDAARVGALGLEMRHDIEAVAVDEAQIDHRVSGRRGLDPRDPFGDAFCRGDGESAHLHGAREAIEEGLVVIDDQQCLLGLGRRRLGGARYLLHGLAPPATEPECL